MDTTPRLGDSDNNLLFKIATMLLSGSGVAGVSSFNARTGAVTLSSADVTDALTFTPANKAGDTFSGTLNVGVDTTDNAQFAVDPDAAAPVTLTRHVADTAPAILRVQKKGTTGNANGAVSVNDNLARFDFYAWDGSGFFPGAVFQLVGNENWSGSAHGGRLSVNLVANGATATTEMVRFTAGAFDLRNSAALQIAGVAYHNPLSVYAAGTVYTLTATSAAVDFGTTDPALTINAAGTYAIRGRVKVALNGATFAANRTLTVKLRRTNNTAADVSNSSTTWVVPIVTTITNTLAIIDLPEVLYTTTNANDALALFADISVLPTAGTISIDEASIVAVRLS